MEQSSVCKIGVGKHWIRVLRTWSRLQLPIVGPLAAKQASTGAAAQ
jgi:hypothetical protein